MGLGGGGGGCSPHPLEFGQKKASNIRAKPLDFRASNYGETKLVPYAYDFRLLGNHTDTDSKFCISPYVSISTKQRWISISHLKLVY